MALPLTVEKWHDASPNLETIRVSGFCDGELNELKSMEHREAIEKLVDMLNTRCSGRGRFFQYGCGIWEVWFDNEFAYMNVGKING